MTRVSMLLGACGLAGVALAQAAERSGAAASFHGLVVDGLTSEPLPGVRVFVQRSDGLTPPTALASGEIECETRTDEQGRFVLGVPLDKGFVWALADGRGAAGAQVGRWHDAPERAVVLELLPAATFELALRDASGSPQAGVEVRVQQSMASEIGGQMSLHQVAWSARTDASGLARVSGLPAEVELRWSVESADPDAPKWTIAFRPGETRRVEFARGARTTVVGHVRDGAGAPVAGLQFALQGDVPSFTSAKATTAADGSFEVEARPFEQFIFRLDPTAGWLDREAWFLVEQPRTEHDIVVEPGAYVTGRLVGTPEQLEWVGAVSACSVAGEWVVKRLTLGGEFRLGPLPAGEFFVAADGDRDFVSETVRVPAGASGVELRMRRKRTFGFRVEGSDAWCTLMVCDLQRGGWALEVGAVRDGHGALAPGKYVFLGWTPDGRVGIRTVELADADGQEIVLPLAPGARCTFVHAARVGLRTLRVRVQGVPVPIPTYPIVPGAALQLTLPPLPMVAELLEHGGVVAHAELAPKAGERLRVALEPR